jgi:hypothetical protein
MIPMLRTTNKKLHGVRQVRNIDYFPKSLFYEFNLYYLLPLDFFTAHVKRGYIVHRCSENLDPRFARPENPAKKTSVRVRTPSGRTPGKDIFYKSACKMTSRPEILIPMANTQQRKAVFYFYHNFSPVLEISKNLSKSFTKRESSSDV